jgi:hypothetical protein
MPGETQQKLQTPCEIAADEKAGHGPRTRFACTARAHCTSSRLHLRSRVILEVALPWSGELIRTEPFSIISKERPSVKTTSPSPPSLAVVTRPLLVDGVMAESPRPVPVERPIQIALSGFVRVMHTPHAVHDVVQQTGLFKQWVAGLAGFVSYNFWIPTSHRLVTFSQFSNVTDAERANSEAVKRHRPYNIVLSITRLW